MIIQRIKTDTDGSKLLAIAKLSAPRKSRTFISIQYYADYINGILTIYNNNSTVCYTVPSFKEAIKIIFSL